MKIISTLMSCFQRKKKGKEKKKPAFAFTTTQYPIRQDVIDFHAMVNRKAEEAKMKYIASVMRNRQQAAQQQSELVRPIPPQHEFSLWELLSCCTTPLLN